MSNNRVLKGIPPDELWRPRYNKAEQEALRHLAKSPDIADRRLSWEYLLRAIHVPHNRGVILEIADILIPDRSNRLRWSVLVGIGWLAEKYPEDLWPLVVKWGSFKKQDIRVGVGVCLLEHILEHHFREYFARTRRIIDSGNERFAFAYSMCSKFGQAKQTKNSRAFDELQATADELQGDHRKKGKSLKAICV